MLWKTFPSFSFSTGRSTIEEEDWINNSFHLKLASKTWGSDISQTRFLLMVSLHTQTFRSPYLRVWFHPSVPESKSLHFEMHCRMKNKFWNHFQQKPDYPEILKLAVVFESCWLFSQPKNWHSEKLNRLTFFLLMPVTSFWQSFFFQKNGFSTG